jgi:nucleoside-diphosphate-sugar epimerase
VSAGHRHPVVTEDLERISAASLPWDQLAGRVVLVTGASGLVASYLVEALLYRREIGAPAPARIVALVRDRGRACARFAAYTGRSDLALVVQDVSEPVRYDGRIDAVVHAAGQATPRHFGTDPVGTYKPNVIGTHHLLERARHDGVESFVFVSSGAVHGAIPETAVLREDVYGVVDPLDLRASYAESKRMGETMCRSWQAQFGVPARIVRLGHTYGPGMRRDDERAFAEFVFNVVDGRDIVLNSDGAAVRPYCYLADATEALLRVLLSGSPGEAYLLANPAASCSIRELAGIVASLYPERGVRVRVGGAATQPGYLPNRDPARPIDTSKITALGWAPMTSLEDGFRRTIASYL